MDDPEKKTMKTAADGAPLSDSSPPPLADDASSDGNELVNVSGHVQEMDRSFGFFSICSMAVLSDNAWGAGGGALVVSFVSNSTQPSRIPI